MKGDEASSVLGEMAGSAAESQAHSTAVCLGLEEVSKE